MTPIYCGETFLYGICEPISTINIMPLSLYEELRYNLNNPNVDLVDTTIKLSNRTNIKPEGVIKNIYVFIGSLMYPLDFHIVDMPRDNFCPILLGRPFVSITKAQIDNKKDTISMMFGEEEMTFHCAKLKKRQYEVEDIKEEKTIAELAAIHFSTPQDELERILVNWEV